eukprot:684795-Alexandrium_andersonii.AAC.1
MRTVLGGHRPGDIMRLRSSPDVARWIVGSDLRAEWGALRPHSGVCRRKRRSSLLEGRRRSLPYLGPPECARLSTDARPP